MSHTGCQGNQGDIVVWQNVLTATGVPDPAGRRLIGYNQTSGGPCFFVDIVEVPARRQPGQRSPAAAATPRDGARLPPTLA